MATENIFSESADASSTLSAKLKNTGENGEGENPRHGFMGVKYPLLYWGKLHSSPFTLHDDGLNTGTRKMKRKFQRNNAGKLQIQSRSLCFSFYQTAGYMPSGIYRSHTTTRQH